MEDQRDYDEEISTRADMIREGEAELAAGMLHHASADEMCNIPACEVCS